MIDPEADIYLSPMMELVPGVVDTPEEAIDTMEDRQGVLIGHQATHDFGPIIFIGVRDKSGKAMVAGVPRHHWEALAEAFNRHVVEAASETPQIAS